MPQALSFKMPPRNMHTLICVTFSLPPGGRGWLRLLLVTPPGLFCLPLYTVDPNNMTVFFIITRLYRHFPTENIVGYHGNALTAVKKLSNITVEIMKKNKNDLLRLKQYSFTSI